MSMCLIERCKFIVLYQIYDLVFCFVQLPRSRRKQAVNTIPFSPQISPSPVREKKKHRYVQALTSAVDRPTLGGIGPHHPPPRRERPSPPSPQEGGGEAQVSQHCIRGGGEGELTAETDLPHFKNPTRFLFYQRYIWENLHKATPSPLTRSLVPKPTCS